MEQLKAILRMFPIIKVTHNGSRAIRMRDAAMEIEGSPLKLLRVLALRMGLGALLIALLARLCYLLSYPKRSIKGKLVMITGASGGVGRHLALEFSRAGANLVLLDLNKEGVEAVAQEVRLAFPQSQVYSYGGMPQADVTNRQAMYDLRDTIEYDCGPVWCLVNNAGIVSGCDLLGSHDAKIVKTFEVNSLAHFWTVKAFLPKMLEKDDGHIVTIASLAGFFAAPRLVDYSASKFAARGFAEGLRMELRKMRKFGVQSTVICPGHIKTDLFKGFSVSTVPSLEPQYVAEMTVYAVQHRRQVIVMPFSAYVGAFMKNLLPTGMMDTINELSGMSDAMNDFDPEHANTKFAQMASK